MNNIKFDKIAKYRVQRIEAWGIDPLKAKIIEDSISNLSKISEELNWCEYSTMLEKIYKSIGEIVGVNLIKDIPPDDLRD